MKKYHRYLEKVHDRVITQEFDRVIPIVADEGRGKSTLMIETVYEWQKIKGETPTTESVLDRVVWNDPDELRHKMATLPKRSAIAVMDAPRLFSKKEAMSKEQKELEKDLFDIRMREHLILLGFQTPKIVPDDMASRRAKNVVHIPARGRVQGFSRKTLDDWDWEKPWPDSDLEDSFPSLDGTELWEEFQRIDEEKKQERISPDEDEDEEDVVGKAVEAAKDNLGYFVSINGRDRTLYLDDEMLGYRFDLSKSEASTARKLLRRDEDIVVEDYRVLLDGEVVKQVDPEDDEDEKDESDAPSVQDHADEVYENLGEYIGKDGRTGDLMLDPDLIAAKRELSDSKSRQIRKLVEKRKDVSIAEDVATRGGEVVHSQYS
jgi:hypothetical protein